MESDNETWMENFHEEAQREDGDNRRLRDLAEQCAVQAEVNDSMLKEIERLKVENDRKEREQRQYQEEMGEFKQFVINNFQPSRSAQSEGANNYSRGDEKVDRETIVLGAGKSPTRQETPSNYRRATEIDPHVFLRKSKGKASREPSKERTAVAVDSTESEGSDDEEPHRSKRKADTPWPLKREKRIIEKEMLEKRATNLRKKEVTPESFSGDVNLSEYLSQFETCA